MRKVERKPPDVSVVVVVYNMPREAPRMLHSLSAVYQRNIAADDYEVIVVDNGSIPSCSVLGHARVPLSLKVETSHKTGYYESQQKLSLEIK